MERSGINTYGKFELWMQLLKVSKNQFKIKKQKHTNKTNKRHNAINTKPLRPTISCQQIYDNNFSKTSNSINNLYFLGFINYYPPLVAAECRLKATV